jgi:hypothetical protein
MAIIPPQMESEPVMPDLWDTNPDNTFNGSGTKPDPAPNGHNDHTKEVPLRRCRSGTTAAASGHPPMS